MTPIKEHPARFEIEGAFNKAKRQKFEISPAFYRNTNKRAFVAANLTDEQRYLYDFIAYVYLQVGLPRRSFAKQLGIKPQTLDVWLGRRGIFPTGGHFQRLLNLYEENIKNVTT